jgi:hypothetical protein
LRVYLVDGRLKITAEDMVAVIRAINGEDVDTSESLGLDNESTVAYLAEVLEKYDKNKVTTDFLRWTVEQHIKYSSPDSYKKKGCRGNH